ncbi:MAG: UDP-N-acetylmuramate dehydrogenase [Clostridia bacterium]|nr:UDP-N-acetylmuramate dehydrogenase [Clostridia bacterium]
MITDAFFKKVLDIQSENVTKDVDMSALTTFKIGGKADVLIEPKSIDAFSRLLKLCKEESVPCVLIGAGSNLLVSDKGVSGVVFKLSDAFDYVNIDGNEIEAGAAVSLAKLSKCAQRASLSGLEFASGIPGTLGGALVMNAGAYGGEMKDVVLETVYLDEDGEIKKVIGDEHLFSYRKSVFSGGDKYIISCKMRLIPKNADEILAEMAELNKRRKEKQPLDKPSAGSTFKRPEGYFAAKLIEDAGLKGLSVGGARVSEKHAGFVVNDTGNATEKDVSCLIAEVQRIVFEKFGVKLSPEIKFIGNKE